MSTTTNSNRIKSTRLSALGRYRLLATIGQGGMAEVFLASLDGPSQFNKLMAVKVLRPELAEDPEGRAMFLEEARLAARLAHPNVIQTTEVGESPTTLYIVMDYLDGQPLSRMMALSRGEGPIKLPLALTIRVIVDALAGLHYAHELSGYDGKPLQLVHRDVSPANIFVTYDGQVKVLDFGIAKAADGDAQTRAGVLKGKIGYLSPEQLSDARPDRRVDVYAAGVMLWEALTHRRLWKGIPDMTALSKIANEGVPSPRTVDPDVPEALERICVRATAKKRDERYATAAELAADLEQYLETCGEPTNNRALGRWMNEAFAEARRNTAELIERQLSRARAMSAESLDALIVAGPESQPMPTLTNSVTHGTGSGSMSAPLVLPPPPRWPLFAGLGGLVLILVTALVVSRRPTHRDDATPLSGTNHSAARPSTLRITATPATAMISLDGIMSGSSPIAREVGPGRHLVQVEAPGYAPHVEEIVIEGDKSLSITLGRTTAPAAAPTPSSAPAASSTAKKSASTPPPIKAAPAKTPVAAPPSPAVPPPATTATNKKIDEENPFAH